jgi:putative N6-adenine-specific DNA methylase
MAVVPPGLEAEAAKELSEFGAAQVRPLRRAVAFEASSAVLYRLYLEARLPFRLLRLLNSFPCRDPASLYAGVQRASDWALWLPPTRSLRVEVSGSAPGLPHSHFTALQVKNALVDWQQQHFGERSSVQLDNPDLVLHLHLQGGMASLSADGCSGSLHRRGWRAAMGLAPLKENLAAGLIRLTGYKGTIPLLDPLCGSGTLLLEAAALALGQPVGLARPLLLAHWPDFDGQLWRDALHRAEAAQQSPAPPIAPIIGTDADGAVIDQARANAEAAGLVEQLQLRRAAIADLDPPAGPGLVVCNPPYGQRLGGDQQLEQLYAELADVLKQRCPGWTLWLLSGNPELTAALRMKASRRVPVSNGGIDCRWLQYQIR